MRRARKIFTDDTYPWNEELEEPIEDVLLQEFDSNDFLGRSRGDQIGTLRFRHRNRQSKKSGGRPQWN